MLIQPKINQLGDLAPGAKTVSLILVGACTCMSHQLLL